MPERYDRLMGCLDLLEARMTKMGDHAGAAAATIGPPAPSLGGNASADAAPTFRFPNPVLGKFLVVPVLLHVATDGECPGFSCPVCLGFPITTTTTTTVPLSIAI